MIKSLGIFWNILDGKQKSIFLRLQVSVIFISLFEVMTIALVASYISMITNLSEMRNHVGFLNFEFINNLKDKDILLILSVIIIIILTVSSLLSVFMTCLLYTSDAA
ncbi:hypothetical protein, partial [Photobacterium phosphoreum]|uniref:hypothetical protein n=1 Tax=Photobacterium phosphoreum TaxID=659 RepID=UPI001960AFFF